MLIDWFDPYYTTVNHAAALSGWRHDTIRSFVHRGQVRRIYLSKAAGGKMMVVSLMDLLVRRLQKGHIGQQGMIDILNALKPIPVYLPEDELLSALRTSRDEVLGREW